MENKKVKKLWNRFQELLTNYGANPFVIPAVAFELFYKWCENHFEAKAKREVLEGLKEKFKKIGPVCFNCDEEAREELLGEITRQLKELKEKP